MSRWTWRREEVIRLLQRRADANESTSHAAMRKIPGALSAIARSFGSLAAARAAAGIETPSRKQGRTTRADVITGLQSLAARGTLTSHEAMTRHSDPAVRRLAHSAIRRFGTWRAALAAAGLALPPRARMRPGQRQRSQPEAVPVGVARPKSYPNTGATLSPPAVEELWPEFARAAVEAAATDRPAPVGLLALPLAAAAAGHQAWLRELGPVLRTLLERQVQWIELASIGPTHRALAKVVAALVANGVVVGPTLTTAAAAWAKAT